MAVTVVRGVARHSKDVGSSSLSPEAVSTAIVSPVATANRASGERLRSALEQAVLSNHPLKTPRPDKVRDSTEARHLAEDVSDEIRARGGEEDAHDRLDPVVAREHFRRQ